MCDAVSPSKKRFSWFERNFLKRANLLKANYILSDADAFVCHLHISRGWLKIVEKLIHKYIQLNFNSD